MKRKFTIFDNKKKILEDTFYEENEKGDDVFDVEKSTNYILENYDIIHTPKQGYFLFNKKYWRNVEENYIAQYINYEMDILSKPYYTDQILKQIRHKRHVGFTELNKDRNKMILSNGTLDISDWKNPIFKEYTFFRDDYSTIHFDFLYDVHAKCPEFNKYLASTFEDNLEGIKVVQEMFGYCLTTSTKQEKIFLFYGEGGSGKSVLIDTLKILVSDENYASVPMSLLDKSFLRAGLVNKILNFSTEECSRLVKDSAINWLKAISSGDPIEAQFKMKDSFSFKPFCKLVFAMNDLPQIENFDDALQRRFVIVQFKKKFRGDEIDLELKEGKLHNEMNGILQFALKGLMRLAQQKDFSCSQESKEMLENFRLESNHAERYASLFLEKGGEDSTCLKVKDVYKRYVDYCIENRENYFKNSEFCKIVKRKFGLPEGRKQRKIDGSTEDIFEGLSFKTHNPFKIVV